MKILTHSIYFLLLFVSPLYAIEININSGNLLFDAIYTIGTIASIIIVVAYIVREGLKDVKERLEMIERHVAQSEGRRMEEMKKVENKVEILDRKIEEANTACIINSMCIIDIYESL